MYEPIKSCGHRTVQAVCDCLLLLCFCLTISGLGTSRWQEIQFQQSGDIHFHGLWEDCTFAYREGASGSWSCSYKTFKHGFSEEMSDFDPRFRQNRIENGQHDNHPWRLKIITMLSFASFCLLMNVMLSVIRFFGGTSIQTLKIMTLVWMINMFLHIILTTTSISVFVVKSNEVDYLTLVEAGQTVRETQDYGVSFWVAVAGCIVGIIVFFVAIPSAALIFKMESNFYRSSIKKQRQSIQFPKMGLIKENFPSPRHVIRNKVTYMQPSRAATTGFMANNYLSNRVGTMPAEYPIGPNYSTIPMHSIDVANYGFVPNGIIGEHSVPTPPRGQLNGSYTLPLQQSRQQQMHLLQNGAAASAELYQTRFLHNGILSHNQNFVGTTPFRRETIDSTATAVAAATPALSRQLSLASISAAAAAVMPRPSLTTNTADHRRPSSTTQLTSVPSDFNRPNDAVAAVLAKWKQMAIEPEAAVYDNRANLTPSPSITQPGFAHTAV